MFHTGQKIGPYILVKRLGRGGFGEVWLAERPGKFATTKFAVKLPLDEQVDHALIEQEAQLWAKASGHRNVLPIIEADEYDGQIVIVSEYAPDGSLEDWLKQNNRMTVEKALETTIQILDGLEFLHSRKIIHRDLKPANILLQGTTPRLADFGISRILRTNSYSNVAGTAYYMSPEAFRGKRSIQSDIWSIGIILYQLLTGKLPFGGNHIGEIYVSVTENEPKFSDLKYSKLKENIFKALAKTPENRYKSSNEMREDLQNSRLILLEEREKRAKLSQRLKIANQKAKKLGITLIEPKVAKKPVEQFESVITRFENEIYQVGSKEQQDEQKKKKGEFDNRGFPEVFQDLFDGSGFEGIRFEKEQNQNDDERAKNKVGLEENSRPLTTLFRFEDFARGLIRLVLFAAVVFFVYYNFTAIKYYLNEAAIKIGIKEKEKSIPSTSYSPVNSYGISNSNFSIPNRNYNLSTSPRNSGNNK